MSPGRLDHSRLRRYLVALDDILTRLSEHTGKGVEALSADTNERWAIERGLQLCTQCVLDIATHLVASAGRDAADYASALDELGRLGILSSDLAKRLRPLAGFRNALVHGYMSIDVTRLHAVLNQHLDEVREFARSIDSLLSANAQSP
jgi:uncharacterized protein YutE (UPF0331/DUF86 family)